MISLSELGSIFLLIFNGLLYRKFHVQNMKSLRIGSDTKSSGNEVLAQVLNLLGSSFS